MHYRMKAETGRLGVIEPDPVKLEILAYPNGKVTISGPLADKELTLDILDAARRLVQDTSVEQIVASSN